MFNFISPSGSKQKIEDNNNILDAFSSFEQIDFFLPCFGE